MSATTQPDEIIWHSGTDLRDDETGIYTWPHPHFISDDRVHYPSVTTCCDLFGSGKLFAERWFIAEYCELVVQMGKEQKLVPCWDEESKTMVERKALDVLADKHWIKAAGARTMTKLGNQGSLIHDAREDWVFNDYMKGVTYVQDDEMRDYVASLIERRGFALTIDYCLPRVTNIRAWYSKHVKDVIWCDLVMMNDTYNLAGTGDGAYYLNHHPGTWLIDDKRSSGFQPSHRIQLAGYNHMEFLGVRNTSQRVPYEPCDHAANLYVGDDPTKAEHGCTLREHEELPAAFQVLLHLRAIYQDQIAPHNPVTVKMPKAPATPPVDKQLLLQLEQSVQAAKEKRAKKQAKENPTQ